MEDKETDPFKEAIRKKMLDIPVMSERDSEIWENVLAETSEKYKIKSGFKYWYAVAASIILFLSIGTGVIIYKNTGSSTQTYTSSNSNSKFTAPIKQQDHADLNKNDQLAEQKVNSKNEQGGSEEIPEELEKINPSKNLRIHELSDHSVVTINNATSLQFSKKFKDKRDIWLTGEAYFEVAPDKSHPFTVHFSSCKLVVLGTKFNIRSLPDDTLQVVTVKEGLVKVYDNSQKNGTEIKAGEQLLISNSRHSVLQKVIPEKYISWKLQLLNFTDQKLEDVCYSLSIVHGVEIKLISQIKNCKFTGDLAGLTLEESIKILCATSSLEVKNENEKYYLIGAGCD